MNLLHRSGVALALVACAAFTSSALGQKSHQFDVDTVTTIPAVGTAGIAAPYPSSVTVGGINAPIGDVKVVLRGLSHTFVTDLDILLVGPTGQSVVLLSRLGGYGPGVVNAEYTFTQGAQPFPPQAIIAPSGRYQPSRNSGATSFPAPAPVGPWGTSLATFKGRSPNGTWSLYIVDQAGGDLGTLTGWSLIISEAPSFANERVVLIPAVGTSGPGAPYPSTAIVDGLEGSVQSVQVMLSGLSHTFQSDLRFMLQGPAGQTCFLYANCGSGADWVNADLIFDDNAASNLPLAPAALVPGTYKPTVCNGYAFNPPSLVAPAPASPYGTTLSVFNGTSPKGAWKLWVEDSFGGDLGNLARGWALIINGQVCPADFNKSGSLEVQDIFDFLNAWFAGCP